MKSGRGDWIRTSDPLRPRQVRYQAALRPDSEDPRFYCGFLQLAPSRASPFGRKLSHNCPRTPIDCPRIPPIHDPVCPKTPADSYTTAVYRSELATRLTALGYEIERGRSGQPEIRGYTREYLDASSPRSSTD